MNIMIAAIALGLQWSVVSGAALCGGTADLPLAAALIAAMRGGAGRHMERAWALGLAVDLFSPCPAGLNSLCYLLCGNMAAFAARRFDPGSMWVRSSVLACAAAFTGLARALAAAAQGAGAPLSYAACSLAASIALTVMVGLAWGAAIDALNPPALAARRAV